MARTTGVGTGAGAGAGAAAHPARAITIIDTIIFIALRPTMSVLRSITSTPLRKRMVR
jgi:hypothetical protein